MDELLKLFFPEHERWIIEYNSIYGYKYTKTINFLVHVLPICIKILVKDGVYFVNNYPDSQT